MKRIAELNRLFFQLYGELYENMEMLTQKQYSYMTDKLYEQYKAEYERIALAKGMKDDTEIFELRGRKSGLVPWKFLIFRNKAAKITMKEIGAEIKRHFIEAKERIRLKKKRKKSKQAEEPGTAEGPAEEVTDSGARAEPGEGAEAE